MQFPLEKAEIEGDTSGTSYTFSLIKIELVCSNLFDSHTIKSLHSSQSDFHMATQLISSIELSHQLIVQLTYDRFTVRAFNIRAFHLN